MAKSQTVLEVAGREVAITNPDKVFFPRAGHTKLDLAKYYAAVADGALRGISARPIVLKRYVNGAESEPFFQKRAPDQHPDWIETVELAFPSGRIRCAPTISSIRTSSGSTSTPARAPAGTRFGAWR